MLETSSFLIVLVLWIAQANESVVETVHRKILFRSIIEEIRHLSHDC